MMTSATLLLLLVVTAIMMGYSSCHSNPDYNDLREAIASSFKCHDNPGMVVAVVKDGKTVLSEAFGMVLPGSNVSVTPDTKFMIASLTKAFTAALMVDVLAKNPSNKSYDLKTPLRDIMGNNFSFADEERTKYGSAEDLLSHRIGLPNKSFMRLNPAIKRSDFIKFARYLKTDRVFRGQAKYSSVAFTLAAAITEHIGEEAWEDLLTERIFKPLGMASTGFAFTTNFSEDNIAKPYSTFIQKMPIDPLFTRVWNSRCGSGCVVSTAGDMTKWMNFILSGGKNASGHQVMPLKQAKTLTSTRTYLRNSRRDLIRKPLFPVTSVADEYALGWRNGYYNGYKTWSHTGSTPGFASMVTLYPDENIGILVAMNGDDYFYYNRLALIHYISDVMLDNPSWLNTSTLCTFPKLWKAPRAPMAEDYEVGLKPALPYIEYIGAYQSPLYGTVFVNYNSSTSSLQGFYGTGSWQLFPQKPFNTFYGKGMWVTDFWDMPGFQFLTKDNDPKNVTKVIVSGFDPRDPPIFDKEFN